MPDNVQFSILPHHVAIVMDGNGRWAKQKNKPRTFGHQAGSRLLHAIVEESKNLGIQVLTVFAFSSENWKRPEQESSFLMGLFIKVMQREINELHSNRIQVRFIGDRSALSKTLRQVIADAEKLTAGNHKMVLQVALSYSGQWDIATAARSIAEKVADGELAATDVDEQHFAAELSFADLPDVDFFIRTGGELRVSNFILWQAAYAELYFSDVLWPDFSVAEYHKALEEFALRQRRFGRTGEQVSTS
ncbi:MAG: polyprenyl diphosphate synthase [Pseudomonadota bacterium]|nr:polyprenyl diphosphate synthase [Pseudomonadota bacterium]